MERLSKLTGKSIYDRLCSSFPISLPTGLAFESLFKGTLQPYDTSRKIPNHITITQYQTLWVNMATLFRNLVSSMDKLAFVATSDDLIAGELEQEMDVIRSLLLNEGQNLCQPVFYFCTYEQLYKGRISKEVKLRKDTTEAQQLQTHKLMQTMKLLEKKVSYRLLDSKLEPDSKTSSLIITHMPYDLLSHTAFKRLDLLESNTGKLKPRNEWYTKYYPVGEDHLNNLPFNQKLLFALGDRSLIHPTDIRLRRLIVNTASARRWTPMTTLEKIMFDLSIDIKEPYVLDFIRRL